MKHKVLILLAILGITLGAGSGQAADAGSLPDLVGTWKGEKTVYFFDGERHSVDVLTITEQSDGHFRGTRTWEHPEDKDALGHKGGELSRGQSEPVLGMIGFDNRTIHIVEHEDHGQLTGHLLDENTMEILYLEPGENAAVFRVVMKREP